MLKVYPELIFIAPCIILFLISVAIEIKTYLSEKKKYEIEISRVREIIDELKEDLKNAK